MIRYRFDEEIAIFKLNTEAYPESANTWDIRRYGYYWKGHKENAIKSYKKAIKIDPRKTKSINRLRELKKKK